MTQSLTHPLKSLRRRFGSRASSRAREVSRPADATAADHLLVKLPVVASSASAREARDAALATPDGGNVYVVSASGKLEGLLPLTSLLVLGDKEPIRPHLNPAPPAVTVDADQEQVAFTAIRYGLTSVPVVDSDQRFQGIVLASSLLRVLHHEHIEDLDRISGVLRKTEHVAHALDEPASRRVANRLPWLLVGLGGSAIATFVVASFEASLQQRVAVAFFIPGIVYLADAIGTQTEAIAVRSVSFQQPRAFRMFASELWTGFLLGLALALPVLPAIYWIFGSLRLGVAVACAIVFAGTVAAGIGCAFPVLLARWDRDPALGSGPLATVVQDVLSLLAYFFAIRLFLE